MIPSGFIQDLLTRIDVVDVVGRHVELKKAGINHKGLCPFHGEKTPSFSVSPTRQTYHCFGCGAHGDAVRFLTEFVGLGFIEAVQELAQQVGMTVPDDNRSREEREAQAQRRRQAATLTDLMGHAAAHYKQQLRKSDAAVAYLKRRGLTGEIAARYGIGYAPEGWHNLSSAFADYADPQLEQAGLVIVHDKGSAQEKRYDRFRHRIMFPIRSVQGEIIGFGGRVLDGGEPKYLNSPETPVFVKGRELYGLHEARTAIRQSGYALVVEGYMDVVALAQSGLGHAVATLGTACTEDHVRRLLRFTDSVVFSFDGDAAGRKAAARALEASLPHASDTRSFRFLFLPPEHDPDSYVRELGAQAFERAVTQAVPLSRQMVAQAQQGCDLETPEGRARMANQAHPLWAALPDGALKRQMLQEFARVATLPAADLAALWSEMSRLRPGAAAQSAAGSAQGFDGRADADPPTTARSSPAGAGSRSSWVGQGRPRDTTGQRRTPDDPLRRGSAPPAIRRSPRSPADWATQLLVAHPAWWHQLSAEDLDLLHELAPPHARLLRWLERDVEEHGPRPWAAVQRALQDDAELWRAWQSLQPRETEVPESEWTALRRSLDQLHLVRLQQQQTALAAQAATDPAALVEYRRVFERWKSLKQGLIASGEEPAG